MAFKFPFTNYHELNLTWILDQLKSLFEKSEENVTVIENYNGRLTAVETELPLVEETAQGASQQAASAATLAQQAKSTADTAQENAIQAQGLAGTARQEAQQAQAAADAATQAAQQAQATAQNFDGRITQAENDASQALEASRSFENRVQSAITTANNAAQVATNAQGIATRADQNAARADQNAALALDTLNAQRSELERIGREQADLITEETESGKTEIENLAQSVLDSIPSDYTTLSNLVDKKAPVIINRASGAVASFNDGADNMKVKKLVVTIEPQQEGSGWTGAAIRQTGKNLLEESSNAFLIESRNYKQQFIAVPENTPLYITMTIKDPSVDVSGAYFGAFRVRGNGEAGYLWLLENGNEKVLQLNITGYRYITVFPKDMLEAILRRYNIIVSIGSAASNYEPYQGNSISVAFPNGAGAVNDGMLTLNFDGTGELVVNGNPSQTYQLTASEISGILKTLYGANNVFSDVGPVSVDYPADTKLYIDGKLAELQATILENI